MAREIEDIDALIGEAGGSAHLFGASSGGALALEAAAAGPGGHAVLVRAGPPWQSGSVPKAGEHVHFAKKEPTSCEER